MSNAKIDDLVAVEMASQGLSNVRIAQELSCDESSVRRALKRAGFRRHLLPVDLTDRFDVQLDKPLVLVDEDCMVTADWHIPLYDPHYVNEMIEKARELNIRTLIIAGDFYNMDAVSAHFPKQGNAGLEREYYEGLAVMRVLAESFDRIYYVWGNHDARLGKALGFTMQFVETMKMVFGALGEEILSKMVFTNLDHMWVEFSNAEPGTERWYICHPQSYSRVPLTTARQIAAKLGANVITAHSHHSAVGFALSGVHVAAEAGGLFDAKKTQYLQRSTTFPNWQNGYAWFKDGRFNLSTRAWATA